MVDDATMYVRATPARTQQDEDWYVSVVRDYVARDDRWTSAGICQYTFLQCSVTLTATWTELGLL